MFRRRTPSDESDASATGGDHPNGSAHGVMHGEGKGRPTPKRREAEQARKRRVKPPVSRREAAKRQREAMRGERVRARRAMQEGDERYFFERDKGPVRRFIRDYIDSRRTIAEFFLPIILVVLALSFVRNPAVQMFSSALWLATMLLVVVDMVWFTFRLKREIRRRFPDDTGRGHTLYAIARASQLRRLRLPKPNVRPGDPV